MVGIAGGASPTVAQTISSGANQFFNVGSPDRLANPITITDAAGTITTATGIRIIIPAGLNLQWADTVTTLDVGGSAAGAISTTPTYSANGDTLTIAVTTDWNPGDQLIISNLVFTNFAAPNSAQTLRLTAGAVTDAQDDHTITLISYGVSVSPHITSASRLPSNGTNYSIDFTVSNTGSGSTSYALLTKRPGGLTTVSLTGTGVTQGGNLDSAQLANVPAGDSAAVTVTYSVDNAAAGSIDTLVFVARAIGSPATIDSGLHVVTLVKPSVTVVKSVNPDAAPAPGTDLTYTLTVTNAGSEKAASVVHIESLPTQLGFKMGSVSLTLPNDMAGTVTYSNDGGTTWTYVPVSAGCSAPAGYDYCVSEIRTSLGDAQGNMGPNKIVEIVFVAKVK